MRSLAAHLRQAENHGRLSFRPDCPLCRAERLCGVLPASGVVSARTQALLAVGALVLGTGGPGVALAAEPDQEQDGTGTPGQTGGSDPATDPDFDPGGDSTDLPPVAAPSSPAPPSDSDNDDTAPPEPEPTTDTDAPIVDPGDNEPAGTEQPPPSEDVPPSTPGSPPPAAPVAPAPAPPAPTPALPAAPAVPPAQLIAHKLRGHKTVLMERKPARARPTPPRRNAADAGAGNSSAGGVPASKPVVAQTGRTVSRDARDARSGDRVHEVRTGESLWSIANDALGGDARPARVAREVDRLWRLNQARIGTGDPDLLAIGTRLRLR
jgi:hypothetical protein